jgi:hypothetical protein
MTVPIKLRPRPKLPRGKKALLKATDIPVIRREATADEERIRILEKKVIELEQKLAKVADGNSHG